MFLTIDLVSFAIFIHAWIYRTLLLNEWANDTTLQSAILSCIPLSVLNTPEIYCHSSQNRPVSYWSTPPGITRLMAWMNIWLEIVGGGEEVADIDGGAGSASSRLVNALSTRKVTGHEAIQVDFNFFCYGYCHIWKYNVAIKNSCLKFKYLITYRFTV